MNKTDNKTTTDLQKKWIFSAVFLLILLIILVIVWPGRRKSTVPPGLLPAEARTIVRALGPNGLDRVVQVISPDDRPSAVSGGTHMMSGMYHGKPYGLAFDIAITNPLTADADVHKLRMQGIAAWRRGTGAPGGGSSLGPHIHCVWLGAPTRNIQNKEQISSFVHRYKGIVAVSSDKATWRDPTITADEVRSVAAVYAREYGRHSLNAVPTYESRHHAAYKVTWNNIAENTVRTAAKDILKKIIKNHVDLGTFSYSILSTICDTILTMV